MKTVMAFGTFDLLHPGHINFLKQTKKYGNLIVIIARDRTVIRLKGKLPHHDEKHRLGAIKGLKLASMVIMGSITDKFAGIKKYKPDIICLGYDQTYFVKQLKEKIIKLKLKTKIIRLKPFKAHKYKTSIIKSKLVI